MDLSNEALIIHTIGNNSPVTNVIENANNNFTTLQQSGIGGIRSGIEGLDGSLNRFAKSGEASDIQQTEVAMFASENDIYR